MTASVRDLVAASHVIVHQRVATVAISGDTLIRLPEGERVPLVAAALDARGFRVRDRAPSWSSSDSTVAALDSAGQLTARAPGRATITAAVGGYSARALVEVVLAPASIVLESGDAQRVPAGRKLPRLVVVRVLSRGGRPVTNTLVRARPEDADGGVEPAERATDAAGRVRASWTLSPRPGRQRLMVSVEGLDTVLTAAAEADPVPGNTKIEVSGAPPAGRVATPLGAPVTIRVTDSLGLRLGDVPVSWQALDDGTVEPEADRTDSLGEARARWTLGPRAGTQRTRVQIGNPRTMPPFVVTASAAAGDAATARVAAGNGQRGPVGKVLPREIVILATDRLGNPVRGTPVRARPAGGSVADSVVASDSTGRARFRWTLGRQAGAQRLELRAGGVDSMVVVTARATPLAAANLQFQNPPATATRARAAAITALVTDAYGNPVPDVPVTFSAAAGTLSASRVMTDDRGRATTRWIPGAASGAGVLTAVVRGTTVRATHTVRVQAGRPRGQS
ncbi:MAG: Ig-like domain-containing protein [Gemmatimonadetes bacterium]|nr:Ig-like domain-containing protein [Gemmatimonadota bacterium]